MTRALVFAALETFTILHYILLVDCVSSRQSLSATALQAIACPASDQTLTVGELLHQEAAAVFALVTILI